MLAKFSLFLCLVCLSAFTVQSQVTTLQLCDPEPNCGPWIPLPVFTVNPFDGCRVDVTTEQRFCNGVPQFRIVSVTVVNPLPGNCNIVDFRALYQAIVVRLLQTQQAIPIPFCPNQSPVIVEVVHATCIYESRCELTFDNAPTNVVCDPPGEATGYTNSTTIVITRHIPCGTGCCVKRYTLCRRYSQELATDYVEVTRLPTIADPTLCTDIPVGAANPCIVICDS